MFGDEQTNAWTAEDVWPFVLALMRRGEHAELQTALAAVMLGLERAKAQMRISRREVSLQAPNAHASFYIPPLQARPLPIWPRETVLPLAALLLETRAANTVEESLRNALTVLGNLQEQGQDFDAEGKSYRLTAEGSHISIFERRRL